MLQLWPMVELPLRVPVLLLVTGFSIPAPERM